MSSNLELIKLYVALQERIEEDILTAPKDICWHWKPRGRKNGKPIFRNTTAALLVRELFFDNSRGMLKNNRRCDENCVNPFHMRFFPRATPINISSEEIPDELTLLGNQICIMKGSKTYCSAVDEFCDLYDLDEIAEACHRVGVSTFGNYTKEHFCELHNITEEDLSIICDRYGFE